MKIILTGSTGLVGREVLNQCIQHPSITSIVALSRRELPAHDKLNVVLMDNFSSYPDTAKEAIKGADACIWYSSSILDPWRINQLTCRRTLGITPGKVSDDETTRRVSIGYTTAAARLFNESCQKPFRFVYCSGSGVEQDQTKPLWFLQNYRRIRVRRDSLLRSRLIYADNKQGQVESELLTFAEQHYGFKPYIVRPALILSREWSLRNMLYSIWSSIKVDLLATKMLDLALEGGDKTVWENSEVNLSEVI